MLSRVASHLAGFVSSNPTSASATATATRRAMASSSSSPTASAADKIRKTEAEWRAELSKQEYHVLREKGTERPGTGEYDAFDPKDGYFACRACGNPLYPAESTFPSGRGWPPFDQCVKGSIETHVDTSRWLRRVEIVCARCEGHLGHVFEGERFTATNERHCVNSVSIKYVPGPLPADLGARGEEVLTKKL